MKRTIMSMLGALAVAVGFSMFAAPAANAYTIECWNVPSSLTIYPYNGSALRCGTSIANSPTQKSAGMAGALNGAPSDVYNHLDAVSATFRIFNNASEYITYFSERQATPPSGTSAADWDFIDPTTVTQTRDAWGITKLNSTGSPRWTALLVTNYNGVTMDQYGNVAQTTSHEIGHWVDWFFANIAGGTTNTRLSDTVMFKQMINRDFQSTDPANPPIINAITPQCANVNGPGLFTGRTDWTVIPGTAPGGYYICDGTNGNGTSVRSKYSGGTNQQIMRAAYGNMFTDNFEIISNITAKWLSTSDDSPHGVMSFLDANRFGCTQKLMYYIIMQGRLPTVSEMSTVVKPVAAGGGAAGCPTSGAGWALNP